MSEAISVFIPCNIPTVTAQQAVKFWDRLTSSNGHWLWSGTKTWNGYGYATWDGRRIRSHRLSWMLSFGDIPDDLCVLHKCDVRNCCNPDHLFLGTRKDNCEDRTRKGRTAKGDSNGMRTCPNRTPKGERNGQNKISESTAINILIEARSKINSQRSIALKYGVCQQQVSAILNGKQWRHLQ